MIVTVMKIALRRRARRIFEAGIVDIAGTA
jgi:hypothetical protein